MFETSTEAGSAAAGPLSNADLNAFRDALRGFDPGLDDAARIARVRLLEEMKAAVAAAQAVEVAAFVTSRRAVTAAEIAATPKPGVGTRRRIEAAERGIVAEVAVARRESPSQASRFIGFALTAPTELPQAFALLTTGGVSERRVLSLHHATSWLTPQHRREADREIAADLPGLGDGQVLKRATAAAARLDPAGACDRIAKAEKERRVSIRPAPESMVWLTALLPLTKGVSTWAALDRAAKTAKNTGDPRSRGQIMADTLVELVTGRTKADGVAIELQLVMTDQALLDQGDGADEPARIVGHGTLPAPKARDLFLNPDTTGSTDPAARRWKHRRRARPRLLRTVRRGHNSWPPLVASGVEVGWMLDGGEAGTAVVPAPTTTTQTPCLGVAQQSMGSRAVPWTAQVDGMTSGVNPRDGTITTTTPVGQTYSSREPDLVRPRSRPLHKPAFRIDLIWPIRAAPAA